MDWYAHATVATIVESNGRFLIVEENIDGNIMLNQPAGHLDPNESLIEAAVRETREETGWDVIPRQLLGIYHYFAPGNQTTYLRVSFIADAIREIPGAELDEGIIQALWLTPEELNARRHQWRSPLLMKNIDDYRAGKHYPLELIYTHSVGY